jgi:hypothetical protein
MWRGEYPNKHQFVISAASERVRCISSLIFYRFDFYFYFIFWVYFYQHENPIWQVMLQTHNKVGAPTPSTWEKKYIKKVEDITTNHHEVETSA